MRNQRNWDILQVFLASLLLLTAQSWLADGLAGANLFESWFGAPPTRACRVLTLVAVLLLCIAAWAWMITVGRRFLPARTLAQGQVQPRKVLIMMVSPKGEAAISGAPATEIAFGDTKVSVTANLRMDIDELNNVERWPWQQLLRALEPHCSEAAKTLERVYLIGTRDKNVSSSNTDDGVATGTPSVSVRGTYTDLDDCVKLLERYVGSGNVHKYRKGIDPENLVEIQSEIKKVIDAAKTDGYNDSDIIIDVTGGQKTQSIGGALVALTSRRLEFQYVDTNPPFHVMTYNVVNEYLPH